MYVLSYVALYVARVNIRMSRHMTYNNNYVDTETSLYTFRPLQLLPGP